MLVDENEVMVVADLIDEIEVVDDIPQVVLHLVVLLHYIYMFDEDDVMPQII